MNPMMNKTPEERKAIARKARETRRQNIERRKAEVAQIERQATELKFGIDKLKKEHQNFERDVYFGKLSSKLNIEGLLREEDIVKNSTPWDGVCGVYFLILNGRVVYVGQSVNVYQRIGQHSTQKKFDSYAYIPCEKSMLDRLESIYIYFLMPEFNGNKVNYGKLAPLTFEEILNAKDRN
jgi:hypothetical protein